MAFIIEKLNTFNESVFNQLYDSSIDIMNNGTYDWGGPITMASLTAEEKKEAVKENIIWYIEHPQSMCFTCRIDSHYIILKASYMESEDTRGGSLTLGQPDATGSRSYLYNDEYKEARKQFEIDNSIKYINHMFISNTSATYLSTLNEMRQPGWIQDNYSIVSDEDFIVFTPNSSLTYRKVVTMRK